MKNNRPVKRILLLPAIMLALMLALPATVYSAELPDGQSTYGTIQVEYRFAEGEAQYVPGTIERYGFTFYLVSKTSPVLENTLPATRTYRYRIEGALTEEQLSMTEGLGDLTITPVNIVLEREVDKLAEIHMDTNDVDDVPATMRFQVTSGTDISGYEYKDLDLAGVTFEVAEAIIAEAAGGLNLPTGYVATVVYRGAETYLEVGYYCIDAVFTTQETEDATAAYVIVADYRTNEMAPIIDEEFPLAAIGEPGAGYTYIADDDSFALQSGNLIVDIPPKPVPKGGPGVSGVWSILSMILSIGCIAIAGITIAMMLTRRREHAKEPDIYNKSGTDRLTIMKWRNSILCAFTVIFGLITLITWLYLDDFSLGMAWINKYTPMICVLFAVTIGLYIFTYLRRKRIDAG